jgi:deoxyribodipyrimidine photo-lyase
MSKITLFWFRRDLRLHDNAGLYHALKSTSAVLPVFIFDKEILDDLEDKKDARVSFLYDTCVEIKKDLEALGSTLIIKYGTPLNVWESLVSKYEIDTVYTNRDFEPYALKRDNAVAHLLENKGIRYLSFKDHVLFEKEEILKDDGTPYTVFTPYSRKWKAKLDSKSAAAGEAGSYYLQSYPNERYFDNFHQMEKTEMPSLSSLGFENTNIPIPPKQVSQGLVRNYDKTRNFPGIEGTSRLGIHFRFGTVSIREKARKARALNETFLNELIWRDFYSMILAHFPHVVDRPFRKKYEFIQWRNNETEFRNWCTGETGYPIVDAGMRELNSTGYMHNRVRMVVASFLTKHLLIDWRWGEAYFAKKLLDFDLSSNNGGWQWAAGCGTDAAPYFRIFNPEAQLKKFDKDLTYVKKWVPEYGTDKYVSPIVDHKIARERCLKVYKEGLAKAESILG